MKRRFFPLVLAASVAGTLLTPLVAMNGIGAAAAADSIDGQWHTMTRVSVSSSGGEADVYSSDASISSDGRYVAFASAASNLVSGDTNGMRDVFVHDRMSGFTERVSLTSSGGQASRGSDTPSITNDGRYVAFVSWASNLVAGDTNDQPDVFVHDRTSGITERVSLTNNGGEASGWSPSISDGGRYVAFESNATNLVAGDTNGAKDVFVHDRVSGVTERVSVASEGSQADNDSWGASISGDGRYIAFASSAANLVAGDTNGTNDVFVHDRVSGLTERVSVTSSGSQADDDSDAPSVSVNGRFVAFESFALNLESGDSNGVRDVFVHDRALGVTERVSVTSEGGEADHNSWGASISGDGRYVAFDSAASNLVSDDTNPGSDVFVHDRTSGTTERVSLTNTGGEANDYSWIPSISSDGRHIAFMSYATNLVPGDTNGEPDIFVAGRSVFADSGGSVFEADMEWLALQGITKGCNPPANTYYCPNAYVTRGQMAAFLVRALGLPAGTPGVFTDDDGSVFEANIEALAESGITKGCNPPVNDHYCPNNYVTRGQMAAFLVRALGYTAGAESDQFSDDDGSIFEADIERLAEAGVTKGCNPPVNDHYCPNEYVTRGQMAAFLHRALTPFGIIDGFEDYPLGSYPSEGGWYAEWSGNEAYVSDAYAHTGDQSFRLSGFGGWVRTDALALSLATARSLSYEIAVFCPSGGTNCAELGFFVRTASNESWMFNSFHFAEDHTIHVTGTGWRIGGPPGSGEIPTSAIWDYDTWYELRAEIDYTTNTVDFWLDDALLMADVQAAPVAASSVFALANRYGTNDGVVYFDDVRIGTPNGY